MFDNPITKKIKDHFDAPHMQQEAGNVFGASKSGRPVSLVRTVHRRRLKKQAILFPHKMLSTVCFNACFTLRRASSAKAT